jgi:NAD(P)-dependent dehydrogenase (short-subunit alcohol dehydrogenase family)
MPLALVTGAAGRLGRVIAQHLSANGFDLVLHVNHSRDEGRKLAKEISAQGRKAALGSCDFRSPRRIESFFASIVEHHGVPDLVVNNASIFAYDFPGKASTSILDESLAVHVQAPFRLLELAYKAATRKRPVTAINVLDQKVANLNPDYFSYTIGKCGLLALTRMWQMNPTAKFRVFGILPGLLFPSGKQTEADFERVRNDTPLGRNPTPQEIANAILFFAQNTSIPGQNLTIDGGESLVRRTRDIAYQ